MRNLTILLLTLIALTACFVTGGKAQITGGAVHGIVRNQLGEPVVGAKVTSIHTATNQQRSTVTDDQGVYRIPSLAVGAYDIIVQADSYQKSTQQVTLQVNEDAGIDVELLAMGAGEQVTVSGAVAAITETNSSVLGIVIDNKQISQLPISGRNFLQLGTLVANVNSTGSLRSGAEGGARNGPFAISGQRDRSLSFLVDGVDNTNTLSDSLAARVSIDSIQEFKMITNLGAAEYGYHSGGTINIITKSGANDFHFTAFEFLRNNLLNWSDYFENVAGVSASHFMNNQFGGMVSGPLIKDRTFFVTSYEGQRLRAGTPQFANVPTAAQRAGIFRNPATGQDVQLPVDPVSAQVLQRYVPLPNVQSQYGNFFGAPNTTGNDDYGMARVDHLLTGDDVINARYYIYSSDTFYGINPEGVRQTGGRPATIPGFALIEPLRTQNLAMAYTHNFSVHTINDLRFGYNHYALDQVPQTQIRPYDVGFTGVQPNWGSIFFTVPQMSYVGAVAYPIYSRIGNYHVADSVSLIKGRHSVKAGGEIRFVRESLSHFEPGHTTIAFSGQASHISPVADFVEGIPVAVVFFNRSQKAPMSQEVYGFFVQDDYQVSRRLVLNLGLRYELATVLESPNHALTNYSIARGLFTPGVNTDTELYNGDHNNFAPRVGFALSLTADGRSVLRGGYGIYYDNIVHTLASTLNKQNTPVPLNMISIAPRGPGRLGGMLQPSVLVPVPLPSVTYDQNIKTPYAQHFNLTLQHEFGRTMILTLGYVGSKGSKLLSLRDINQAVYLPGVDASGKPLSTADPNNIMGRRPTQLFHLTSYPVGELDALESSVSSIYHSFQATFNKRISRGFSVLGTYTWSRSLDDESDPYGFTGDSGFPQNSYNVKADRARSIFDIAHQGTLAATYEFPFKDGRWAKGWQVNAVATVRTGQPFSTTLGFDPTLTGRTFVRPNFVPGALVNKDGQVFINRNLPIDPANGFPVGLIPGPGQDGTLGRNTFTMAGYRNLDISVAKQTQLMERLNVQARFEMFNVFNTTDLALPERRLIEPYYGKPARTQDVAGGVPGIGGGGPRGIQLSLRVAF